MFIRPALYRFGLSVIGLNRCYHPLYWESSRVAGPLLSCIVIIRDARVKRATTVRADGVSSSNWHLKRENYYRYSIRLQIHPLPPISPKPQTPPRSLI